MMRRARPRRWASMPSFARRKPKRADECPREVKLDGKN